jgi:hypothetical protein
MDTSKIEELNKLTQNELVAYYQLISNEKVQDNTEEIGLSQV